MKIYRGPSSKPFTDHSHELVDIVISDALKNAIENNRCFSFSISKKAGERQSVCNATIEESDIVSIMEGVIVKLKRYQDAFVQLEKLFSYSGSFKGRTALEKVTMTQKVCQAVISNKAIPNLERANCQGPSQRPQRRYVSRTRRQRRGKAAKARS